MPSTLPLIKGYLPLRIHLPSRLRGDDTFMFLKEHKSSVGGGSSQQNKNASRTLFVSNVPLVPGVRTSLLLRALFGRYGDVESVSVVRNPRKDSTGVGAGADAVEPHRDTVRAWDEIVRGSRWFGDSSDGCDEGKFAHVTFTSSKECRDALRSLRGVALSQDNRGSSGWGSDEEEGSGTEEKRGCVDFRTVEVQELVSESKRLRKAEAEALAKDRHVQGDVDGVDVDDDDDHAAGDGGGRRSGVLVLAEKYRSKAIPRDVLMDHCNSVMLCFEATEESDRKSRAASSMPDDDGFVTVTYGSSVGSKRELEAGTGGRRSGRRKGSMRSRKKKESRGATELTDFYRFQKRETRKRGIQELRKRFEEDLAAVKKMKEEKMYRPF